MSEFANTTMPSTFFPCINNHMKKSFPSQSSRPALVFCLFAVFLIGCRASRTTAVSAVVDSVVVFDPGSKYATNRIPALAISNQGTLLAFCEGRLSGSGDWAAIDILMRRSIDKGKTWEDVRTFVEHDPARPPTSNPTPIVDKNGTIHFLFQRNYERAYYIHSTDEGKTWSEPTDITYVFEKFRDKYNWKVLAPGPGHAIQLRTGRLLVPVWLCEPKKGAPGGDHRPSCIATIYSDDAGKTWQAGDIITNHGDIAANSTIEIVNPSENVAIELADGRVMLNMRTESLNNRRLISYSPDGATNWTKPAFDDELYDPVCMASLIRISGNGDNNRKRILFVNPDSHTNPKVLNKVNFRTRENLTARLSYDEGESWTVNKVLWPGIAGYSDLAVDKDGMIYCLFERREAIAETSPGTDRDNFRKFGVIIKKFNLEWLTDGKDRFANK